MDKPASTPISSLEKAEKQPEILPRNNAQEKELFKMLDALTQIGMKPKEMHRTKEIIQTIPLNQIDGKFGALKSRIEILQQQLLERLKKFKEGLDGIEKDAKIKIHRETNKAIQELEDRMAENQLEKDINSLDK